MMLYNFNSVVITEYSNAETKLTCKQCFHRLSKFEPTCEATCDCDRNKFSPICGADGRTYFSACHAGCSNYTIADGKVSSVSAGFDKIIIIITVTMKYIPLATSIYPMAITRNVIMRLHYRFINIMIIMIIDIL